MSMSSLSRAHAKCSEADLEIKSRQEEFGVDLFDILQDHENAAFGHDIILPDTFTFSIKDQWFQAHGEIEKYIQKQDKMKHKKQKKSKKRYHADVVVDQWVLQRKQQFGVDAFGTAFELLGTVGNTHSISTLSPHENHIHALVQEAVQDVLLLERMKDSYMQEIQLADQGGLMQHFCDVVMCC